MIDFVDYVVSELSSKRLSKSDARALITQFRRGSTGGAPKASHVHPLLHRNTSDLTQQSYCTVLSGNEFFLRDHRVNGEKVLPAVAYLEMVRIAIRTALPLDEEATIALHNVIWAQPIVVTEQTEVSVALLPSEVHADGNHLEYEVYTVARAADGSSKEVIHSQGLAVITEQAAPVKLDVAQLGAQMTRGKLEAAAIYAAYDQMGIAYGTAHKGVTAIHGGEREVLAQLSLPTAVEATLPDYVLHPSLMDAALQAAVGLVEDIRRVPDCPTLPFALESLRILSACTKEMLAWLRFSPGSKPEDKIRKLDIDLCDLHGNVCVQMRGFTSRELNTESKLGTLYAAPSWDAKSIDDTSETSVCAYEERHIVVCGLPSVDAKVLEAGVPNAQCLPLQIVPQQNAAQRYRDVALACFERIKTVLAQKRQGRVLLQIVVTNGSEDLLLLGLAGLLKTAAIENPAFAAQMLVIEPHTAAAEVTRLLQAEQARSEDTVVKYEQGTRHVLRLQNLRVSEDQAEIAFKDGGVYLITGGLGGLGVLFTKEILAQARGAKVILTGRSELTADKKAILETLSPQEGVVEYRQLDLANAGQVRQLVAKVVEDHKQLSGVLHCAGMIRDSFILKKTADTFLQVLEPKVAGTFNLDEATQDVELDFLALFSAGASVTGNNGQADYAAANGFMDRFAVYRNQLVASRQRKGKTRAINWPLWEEGGMGVDVETREQVKRSTSLVPMRTATGMQAFHRSWSLPHDQIHVVEGEVQKLREALFASKAPGATPPANAMQVEAASAGRATSGELQEKTENFLKKQLSSLLKLPVHRIDAAAPFEKYGINSIMMMNLTNELEKTFGSLPKTLFFEYQSLSELARYFTQSHSPRLSALFAATSGESRTTGSDTSPPQSKIEAKSGSSRRIRRPRRFASTAQQPRETGAQKETDPIAIVGLSGRYPKATNIQEYWVNLRDGKDCIVEVPRDRWDWREYFTEDRSSSGSHYSKWGGFIDGVDEFDPLFFSISPADAESIDPQERLFLQHVWMALEDAGYTRAGLQAAHVPHQAGEVGVYVGVMYGEYQLFGAEASLRGQRIALPTSYASIANRVSYFLNVHGPSMAVDTMCSSSLTSIHLACEDLKRGRTSLAIAGGVNVTVHPNKYLLLSSGQFIASDGRCQSFGEGGDGYIPAEGVGAVVLKRLSEAQKDGNHIYGVIKGSALNHGGKTNGYSVPNPQAQASVIGQALKENGIEPRHISYVEAHGTGTKLGDPIEIAALTQVFRRSTSENQFCLIGSAKSNIGHGESAAGIAGLTKVLLQMKHRLIVPSLHSAALNPHIDFQQTPFVVNQTLRDWEQPEVNGQRLPRIAGVSSFGAGGSNAHLLVEEYSPSERAKAAHEFQSAHGQALLPLSARTPEQLKQKVRDLLAFIRTQEDSVDLASMAYTLQVGREAMEERFGLLVTSVEQLAERLQAYVDGEEHVEDGYRGEVRRNKEALSVFSTDTDLQETIAKWIAAGKLSKLLELWAKGLDVDWNGLYRESQPHLISLPTYPFARERYWIDTAVKGQTKQLTAAAMLHPLLHVNTSDFSQQSYRSTFTGAEFFLADHRVALDGGAGQKFLPGVAYLEMARAAVEQALPARPGSDRLDLRNIVWAQPLVVAEPKQVHIALSANDNEQIDFEIYSEGDQAERVHCQGHAAFSSESAPGLLNLAGLKGRMQRGTLPLTSVYEAYAGMGLHYGEALRGIAAIELGEKELLARLRMPAVIEASQGQYLLHPSLMDAALQAAIGLVDAASGASTKAHLPFALGSLRIFSGCTTEMFAWVRYSPGSGPSDEVIKLDIDLCDGDGRVCVQMHELASRPLGKESGAASSGAVGSLLVAPVWQTAPASASMDARRGQYAEHHVILGDLLDVEVKELETLLPRSRCLKLQTPRANTLAERYSEHALVCFEKVKRLLESGRQGKVLVQIVVANSGDQSVLAGLSGLLRTAALENPQFTGQVIFTAPDTTTRALAELLQNDTSSADRLIKYEQGSRQALRWQETPLGDDTSNVAFKDDGVYLITGGLGGLGVLFAKEILQQTSRARIILTGRSTLDAEKQTLLDEFPAAPGRVHYRTLDLGNLEETKALIAAITQEHQQLTGILHSAGMLADNFILNKSSVEFSRVLAPKVTGTYNLDQAAQEIELDFFVLFSSVSAAMGNAGQADYAAANGFMDQFAAYRNRLVGAGQRRGRTLSIDWPLWREGGMHIDPATLELLQQATGMQPMQTVTGMRALYRSLDSQHSQTLILEGDVARLRRVIAEATLHEPVEISFPQETTASPVLGTANVDGDDLVERTEDYLREQLSVLLKLPAHKIDPQAALENYGIDSVLVMKMTNILEKTFGSLSKTLFFEYQTIARLAGYLVKAYPDIVRNRLGVARQAAKSATAAPASTGNNQGLPVVRGKNRFFNVTSQASREVAIVGLSGKYPLAENLQEFWENLKSGRDCITEIPADRWDHTLYFDPDRSKAGKTYSKWGGFIADVDKFDPLFFNISPREAEIVDPQERLFLQTAWHTIEDAGYSKESLAGKRVGVFVGVMWSQYELFGAGSMSGRNPVVPTSSHASIANRVSYFFDFHGPSIALDTMCSSSLTAIHLASEEIRRGNIDAALAGGVNLSLHPQKYLNLSQGKFAASDGRCRSFGAGGDGYVPGEGVGAVLLKPLEDALRDGDHIYAVIKSSTVNHGGKTNGYTVPNPNAQGDLILDALKNGNIDPRTLSYIETHGTGTSLGDPIEITGLKQAFAAFTDEKRICPIGSVKSNIGHLESAAGIAAVTKALLQIKHEQLVPSLHAEPSNPNIDFDDSPFYVQTSFAEWKRRGSQPRRVAVSSFGAGGANAHLILEEHVDAAQVQPSSSPPLPEAFLVSARDQDALYRYAARVATFLEHASDESLADMAYTSQVGRTAMPARLAVIAASLAELKDRLNQWLAARTGTVNGSVLDGAMETDGVFYGNANDPQYNAGNLIHGAAGRAFLHDVLAKRDLARAARLWTLGADIDWTIAHQHARPRRVSLPTYPFAKDRYWVEAQCLPASENRAVAQAAVRDDEGMRRTYYRPHWKASPLAASAEGNAATGPILILDGGDAFVRALRTQLNENGAQAVAVLAKPGMSFQEVAPDEFTIAYDREEDFERLVQKLKARGTFPRLVLHRCAERSVAERGDDVARQLNQGVYALLHACQALMTQKQDTPPKLVSFFSTGSEDADPLSAALAGFYRSLNLENPKYVAKIVDMQAQSGSREISVAEEAAFILDELREDYWTTSEIRYCCTFHGDGHTRARYVREYAPYQPAAEKAAELPLRQHGVYIVTGGLGGLGFIFAEYLAKNFRAKLVLVGRGDIDAAKAKKIQRLEAQGGEVRYSRGDVARRADMERIVQEAKARFGRIDGVIHSAGVNRDSFILKKTRAEMTEVLDPKVHGAINLDHATREEALDLFVLFSSVAGALGNLGQCDYAYANHFLDSFAEARESLRAGRKRSGRTLAINWPFWEEGGMPLSRDAIASSAKHAGMYPLPTDEGIRYWEDFLRSDLVQGIALYGTRSKIAAYLARSPVAADIGGAATAKVDTATLRARTVAYLKALIGEEIKLAPERIDARERLESFGIDSIMVGRLNEALAGDFGALPKTLFYEYETIEELAKYLVREAATVLTGLFGRETSAGSAAVEVVDTTAMALAAESLRESVVVNRNQNAPEPIAIIGVHGYYPQSKDLAEYWENLRQGKDLVETVPANRWDCEEFYDPDPDKAAEGKIYCKWGAFLDDVDKFDARFFNIAAEEARSMDPQERLFLSSVWGAIEDAGYTRESLKRHFPKAKSADVGVFVGVTTNTYHLLGTEEWSRGNIVSPSALPWSIANRVSYFFDFQGPSMPVDTACSSSLVAMHLACESLHSGECQVAVAGGVNLYLHPSKYHGLCQKRMLSLGGKTRSFGAGDDGFVPGEGVGTLILKPLSKALEHGDHVYAVVLGSACDHSGRSNGYSAPNPNSQASLISRVLTKAGVHPESIGYIEGHGTGTQLGDNLEITALTRAFRKQSRKLQFCPVGSMKANLGHSESAAGIAGVTKILLQMKHRQLAPSIHSNEVNPNIEFERSPFYLQHELSPWERSSAQPRRALINSFGAGGVNACVVLEEYEQSCAPEASHGHTAHLIVLCAKDEERLSEYVERIVAHLRREPDVDLAALSYTLQVGREAMPERLALVVKDVPELIEKLAEWTRQKSCVGVHRGSLDPRRGAKRATKKDREVLQPLFDARDLNALAQAWTAGEALDWEQLYSQRRPVRIPLPSYPFAKERYWVSDSSAAPARARAEPQRAQLHPLVSYNSSTLKEVTFSSWLSRQEFYARDHRVNGQMIFPGSGFLEIACVAGTLAGAKKVRKIQDVVFVKSLVLRDESQLIQISLKPTQSNAEYVITSYDEDREKVVHSEGVIDFDAGTEQFGEENLPVEALKKQCSRTVDGAQFYELFEKCGISYGPAFRTMQHISIGDSFALSKLTIADHMKTGFDDFVLHPCIIDGALQTVSGLMGGAQACEPHLPFAIEEVLIAGATAQSCHVLVEQAGNQRNAEVRKFNIKVANEKGVVFVTLKNFCVRVFKVAASSLAVTSS